MRQTIEASLHLQRSALDKLRNDLSPPADHLHGAERLNEGPQQRQRPIGLRLANRLIPDEFPLFVAG